MTPAKEPVIYNLTPFSVIISEQPFQAMVYHQLTKPVSIGIRTFREGFRLRVTKEYDPEINESDVYCRFTNLKTQRTLERFIIPEHYRDHPSYSGFYLAIRWEEFLASFKIKKMFKLKHLDYSKVDHIYVAVRQHVYDQNFPLKVPEYVFEEINQMVNGLFALEQYTQEELLMKAAKIAFSALDNEV